MKPTIALGGDATIGPTAIGADAIGTGTRATRAPLPGPGRADACTGRLVSGDPERRFHEFALDSRTVPRDSLFVAIPGARADGHDFVAMVERS